MIEPDPPKAQAPPITRAIRQLVLTMVGIDCSIKCRASKNAKRGEEKSCICSNHLAAVRERDAFPTTKIWLVTACIITRQNLADPSNSGEAQALRGGGVYNQKANETGPGFARSNCLFLYFRSSASMTMVCT